jgi:exopolysaccharide production protein ExoZ
MAAMLVVFTHAATILEQHHWPATLAPLLRKLGYFGVDVFFIISGFLMVVTTSDKAPGIHAAKEFMRLRLLRIVPLYWLMTTVVVAPALLLPRIFKHHTLLPSNVLASYFFLPSVNASGAEIPVLYVAWTLIYEMFFYVVFTLLLRCTVRRIVPALAVTFISLSLLGMFGWDNIFARTYTNSVMLEFVLGCGIAWLYLSGMRCSNNMALAAIAGCVALLPLLHAYKPILPAFIHFGIPAALLTLGCLYLEKNRAWPALPLLQRIGDGSYSIYLSHIFILPVLGRHLLRPDTLRGVPGDLMFGIMVAICAAFGYLVHQRIEKPMARFLRKRGSGTAPIRSEAGG